MTELAFPPPTTTDSDGHRTTTCYEDGDYRLLIFDYSHGAPSDLYLDWRYDSTEDWIDQVPLPVSPARARTIAAALTAWANAMEQGGQING